MGHAARHYAKPKDHGKVWRPLRGMRQHRKAHFSFDLVHHSMGDVAMTQGAAKKAKQHEAHLIPGVDGSRIFGFPNSIITKLRYCTRLVSIGTLGAPGITVFAANGIFDPDITNIGHQPLYRDTYAGIYDQYVVLGSKITVTYMPRTAGQCVLIGIVGDDDSTISTNVETLMEQNNSVSSAIGQPGAPLKTLTSTFEPLQAFGVAAKDDGSSQTAVGSNPSELWCFGVWHAAADQVTTIYTDIKVEIEYTVKFAELTTPVQN